MFRRVFGFLMDAKAGSNSKSLEYVLKTSADICVSVFLLSMKLAIIQTSSGKRTKRALGFSLASNACVFVKDEER